MFYQPNFSCKKMFGAVKRKLGKDTLFVAGALPQALLCQPKERLLVPETLPQALKKEREKRAQSDPTLVLQ